MIDLGNIESLRENNRIEAKKATGGLPLSIWETYSAFANADGGVILLGVEEYDDKSLHVVNILNPEDLVYDFWDKVNDPCYASKNILNPDDVTIEEVDGKNIVIIRVPPAKSQDMPVYVGGDMYSGTYIRNGEGDFRCDKATIDKMIKRDR